MYNWAKYLTVIAAAGCMAACSPSGAEAQQTQALSDVSEVSGNWTVDKLASSISFTGSMGGDEFTGNFGDFEAVIQFDVDDLDSADIRVSIGMASVDANDQERNDALPGKEWFFVKSFPQAFFKSNQIAKTGDNDYEAVGTLTLRDVTKPITLPFSLKIEDEIAKATANISINRADFGVGTGMWKNEDWVAHNVGIKVEIHAEQNQ